MLQSSLCQNGFAGDKSAWCCYVTVDHNLRGMLVALWALFSLHHCVNAAAKPDSLASHWKVNFSSGLSYFRIGTCIILSCSLPKASSCTSNQSHMLSSCVSRVKNPVLWVFIYLTTSCQFGLFVIKFEVLSCILEVSPSPVIRNPLLWCKCLANPPVLQLACAGAGLRLNSLKWHHATYPVSTSLDRCDGLSHDQVQQLHFQMSHYWQKWIIVTNHDYIDECYHFDLPYLRS